SPEKPIGDNIVRLVTLGEALSWKFGKDKLNLSRLEVCKDPVDSARDHFWIYDAGRGTCVDLSQDAGLITLRDDFKFEDCKTPRVLSYKPATDSFTCEDVFP